MVLRMLMLLQKWICKYVVVDAGSGEETEVVVEETAQKVALLV